MNIFYQKKRIKILILIVALIIGVASVYYTNTLVSKLALREQKLIDLYANGLRFLVNSENTGNLTFLFNEIIEANHSIPVILTDDNEKPIDHRNIRFPKKYYQKQQEQYLQKELAIMKIQHKPIIVNIGPGLKNYIFYKNSHLLSQLKYYPYIQLTVITIFGFLAYLAFSYSRKAEQNRVWVGLAKETAHQLGTPISSLMAWITLFKNNPKYQNDKLVEEFENDLNRLEIITARFSQIGSIPALKDENILDAIKKIIDYLQKRSSLKLKFNIASKLDEQSTAKINIHLFDWVIENICKNAMDAMDGEGEIKILIKSNNSNKISIDIEDIGKGIPRAKLKKIFHPGYTTKQRGWGLGLTLTKRIIENYHSGKIFVKRSELGKGTIFRIILNR